MLQLHVLTSTTSCSASMILFIGLVHFLYLSQLVGSATIKSLNSASNHQSTVPTLQAVKSASRHRRSTISNSGCYQFLNEKEGCAYANPTNNCARKMSSTVVQLFAMGPLASNMSSDNNRSSSSEITLSKRSQNLTSSAPTPENTTSFLAVMGSGALLNSSSESSGILGNTSLLPSNLSESSICGSYASEEQMGVCLWSGPSDVQDGTASGWVSSDITGNCHKEVILQRSGSTSPLIVARVLEGCSFNTTQPSIGCSQIYITKKVFMALNPSPSELEKEALEDPITWDFNSRGNIFNSAV